MDSKEKKWRKKNFFLIFPPKKSLIHCFYFTDSLISFFKCVSNSKSSKLSFCFFQIKRLLEWNEHEKLKTFLKAQEKKKKEKKENGTVFEIKLSVYLLFGNNLPIV